MMAPVVKDALNACRVCLALNVKMYHMKNFKLSEMFQNITGISVIENHGSLLQRVCWECAARLTAAAAFREKALFTDALLKTQVNIKESDIALLKQNYSSLKSPLCVKTAVNSFDIECEHTISENEIENTLKNIKTETNINETSIEFEVCEPWVGFPVKTEVDSDSTTDDNMELEDRKSVTVDEHFNDTSSKEDGGSQLVNTEPQINNTEKIVRGDIDNKAFENEVPVLNNVNIVFIKEEPEVEKKPKLDSFGNIVHEPSSGEDRHIEGVSCDKEKQNKSKVGVKNIKKGKAANRINESLREKIIALRKKRFSVPAIVKETGASVASIRSVLYRSNCNVRYHRYASQTEVESDSEQKEAGKELTACSPTVRKRMREAGFEHILMKKPEVTANVPQNLSKNKELHNHLKQRIIALKQEGMSISRIAYLLDTTRMTVRKWWERWCNEGHMDNYKSPGPKKKTTPQEDKLLIERVTQEGSIHTPSLAKELGISTKCVRSRLRAAGFILENRKPSVPLRSGRNHKVDEATKQQIISMKHNGVGVTEIANQFRVTRTSVYVWWRRWCKENNIEITKDNPSTAAEDQSLTEQDTGEKNVRTPPILSSLKSKWHKSPKAETGKHNVPADLSVRENVP